MNVVNKLLKPSLSIDLEMRIDEAYTYLSDYGLDGATISDSDNEIIGVITKNQILQAIGNGVAPKCMVKDLMSTDKEIIKFANEFQTIINDLKSQLAFKEMNESLDSRKFSNLLWSFTQLFQEQKSYWEACIDSIYNPLVSIDNDGNVNYFNKAFEKATGISAADALGRNINDLFRTSGLVDVLKNLQPQVTQRIEEVGTAFISNRTPIIKDGQLIGAVAVLQEIADLEQIAEELERTKELNRELDAIIESSFDGLYITDGYGNTLRINKGFERITGVGSEECVGRNMAELVEEGVFSDSGSLLALEKRESVTINLTPRSGKEILVTSTPIFNDNGDIALIVTNVRDITELNELERKLKHMEGLREKELDAIFDSSYDGLYITDGEANTIRLNKAFERVLGVKSEECIGRNMEDLVREGIFSRSGTLLALEKDDAITITLQAKTGRTALVTSTPIRDDHGNIILVVTNVRDISELNELQEKLEQFEGLTRAYQTELQELKLRTQCVVHSSKMRDLVTLAVRVASVDSTVLIQGESGVGKELVANTIQSNSNRRDGPYIKINCGAIPENLLESELFGYEPGAFSGAGKQGKPGMFELANGGTLFLDEIGDLPLSLQVKLLRVIQERQISRVGGTTTMDIDVRILTGTNYDLGEMVKKKLFRKDLYYRLNVIPIHVPPLRERRDDIPVLSQHFLEKFNQRHQLSKRLSNDVLAYFITYDWPGNVRELENLIERLVVTSLNDTITLRELSSWSELGPVLPGIDDSGVVPLQHALENTERRVLENAFSIYSSTYAVAKALGISQPTVVRKAAKYGIKFGMAQ
ncbi:MAG: sigma 54-interacting transcriptional regulator [Syntrophomonas sp.]